ncbi:hypothetical protein HPB51_016788 [Rhipicephalus microplus]|uniref:Uncharacterized protein n=1 Tax=Rhipicephalus microplus TaxID=6941 RepID=A0A9J6DWB0_RHIMP|nr:hypothetical protein HPB51_016788 [Rhipicephalus microplus]
MYRRLYHGDVSRARHLLKHGELHRFRVTRSHEETENGLEQQPVSSAENRISDPFDPYQDSSRHATGSHITANAGYGKTYRSAHIFRSGKGVLGGTHVVRGFGSECSLEHQCNALLGLACTSNGKRMSRCACAPSTPVYVNEGGVQKCVRPKDIYEGCVSNQECNFKNPNAQCVNFLCNCSEPFQLTAARLCQLPTSPAGNIFPAAISVMLLLAALVAGGGYAYQKMLRDRGRSSSLSTKAGPSARADTSSTSSTAHAFGEGWAWGRSREYRDSESNMLLEPRRLRTQSEVSLPRHPPRYISYKASRRGVMGLSTLHECCSQAEHSSAASESDPQCVWKDEQEKVAVEASLLRRTSEKRDLACQQKCEIEAKPERSMHTSSTPIDMMLPKDEQIRKLLNDDREIVVTVETRKGRHRLLTTPSPPPVFTLPKRGLPPLYESTTTDDPFMKDLKRRRGRLGGRYSADLSTAVTASTLRSTSPSVTATGRPSRGTALTAVPKVQRADAFPTMREKTQQQRILEDHSRSVNSEDALTIENELISSVAVRESRRKHFETRDHSPSFPEAGGLRRALCRRACTPSFISEKAPSLSFQKPCKELMAKISEHQIRFAERPFVDVLASLESEFTSIVKDEQKVDMPNEKGKTHSEPQLLETNNEPGSDRYDEDSGNLGEKALCSFLADDEVADFEPDAASDEAVDTCTSAESAKVQSRHSTASPADAATKTTLKTTVITLKSEESSKLKVLPAYSASNELRKSVQSVTAVMTAATSKAGNCANLSAGAAGRDFICEPNAKPATAGIFERRHQFPGAVSRFELFLTASLGMAHGAQQREVKTATWLGETQYVLPHIQDPGQLGITPKAQHISPGSLNQLDGALTQGSHKFNQEPLNECPAASSNTDIKGHESRNASFEPLKLKDLSACRVPGIDKRASTLRMFNTFNVPPLRTLCSQVLPPAETVEEKHTAADKSNVETPSCSLCTRLESGTTCASPNETPSKKKSPRARLSLDALADTTATCAGHEEAALSETKQHRRGRSQSVVISGVTHEWSYQEPGPSRKINEAAAAITAAKGSIRFIGPPTSQNIIVLPDSSVAIRLPEGARQTNVWAPATGTSLRRGSLGTGLAARHRHLQLANALEYPSFESIYNAILQAVPPPAETAMGEPGDVPSRPARRASSASRTVSFDNSPTVVPLEPPPEPFAGRDLSQMDSERAATPPQIHRPRRRSSLSSLCCSSSGSLLQEVTDTTDLIAILDARRASLQLASLRLEQESTPDTVVSAAKNSADPETTPIVASAAQTATPLTSSFYSFEDTVSELSFLPDTANVNSSGSLPASQRTEEAGARDQHHGYPT